jgi:ketosteroid isomerase-like protein
VLAPDAAVFTGAFRTVARDAGGRAWGAHGVVTFVARHGPSGWQVVNWHTSEATATP